jgi:hypothetical protein
MARPTKYTKELAHNFCMEIIAGKSVRTICKNKDYPTPSTIFNWLSCNKEFLEQYEKAKEIQADVMADDILSIADNPDGDVQRDRLRIDARKWVASKLKPKKYGQLVRQEIESSNTNKQVIDYSELSDEELDEIIAQGES